MRKLLTPKCTLSGWLLARGGRLQRLLCVNDTVKNGERDTSNPARKKRASKRNESSADRILVDERKTTPSATNELAAEIVDTAEAFVLGRTGIVAAPGRALSLARPKPHLPTPPSLSPAPHPTVKSAHGSSRSASSSAQVRLRLARAHTPPPDPTDPSAVAWNAPHAVPREPLLDSASDTHDLERERSKEGGGCACDRPQRKESAVSKSQLDNVSIDHDMGEGKKRGGGAIQMWRSLAHMRCIMTLHAREESPSAKGNDGQEDTLGRRKEKEAPMRVMEERCCAHEPHKYSEDRISTAVREWRKRARVRIREEVEGPLHMEWMCFICRYMRRKRKEARPRVINVEEMGAHKKKWEETAGERSLAPEGKGHFAYNKEVEAVSHV
ncbi:hypothetical protein B0H13DRAFT_1881969 [Mycena leptocephala]|nr:hypothetical protein B0H13DRAFT_1881969 [Mycena leptocephala]